MARPKKEQNLHRGYRVYIRFNELEYGQHGDYGRRHRTHENKI